MLIFDITTGAFLELLPPFPIPKDCKVLLSTEHVDGEEDDGELPEPLLGDSGHVPLPPTERFVLS